LTLADRKDFHPKWWLDIGRWLKIGESDRAERDQVVPLRTAQHLDPPSFIEFRVARNSRVPAERIIDDARDSLVLFVDFTAHRDLLPTCPVLGEPAGI